MSESFSQPHPSRFVIRTKDMHSKSQHQYSSPKSRVRRQSNQPLCCSGPSSIELSPFFNDSGRSTPPSEDFNQFLFDSRKSHIDWSASGPSPAADSVVAVVGVGYVGFQLVRSFSKHYPVMAYDVNKHRIESLRQEFDARSVYLTSDPAEITQATHILIAVPTRVHEEDKSIDTSHLESAINLLARHARPGAVVVVESSVAVGMTRKLLGPLQRVRNFKVGMSPERVDPGRTNIDFEAIPKVISGLDTESLQAIQQLYEPVFDRVVPVSTCEVAEMTKLYENCQRMIAIAYANEMADACQTIGIDPTEVCSAAATKPFGYQPYSPGAGVGGHCIPVNPYYLLSNMNFPLLRAATEKMWQRPSDLANKVMDTLTARKTDWKISTSGSSLHQETLLTTPTRILVVGVAFKPGQSVTSHSPGIGMIDHLVHNYDDIHVDFCDPLVSAEAVPSATKMKDTSEWDTAILDTRYDAIIVAMAQHGIDLAVLKGLQRAQVFNFTSSLKGFGSLSDQRVLGVKRDSAVVF